MTTDELQAIKARADVATDAPWYADDDNGLIAYCTSSHEDGGDNALCPDCTWLFRTVKAQRVDVQFVAHARQDVPALVDEVLRLRTTLAASPATPGTRKMTTPLEERANRLYGAIAVESGRGGSVVQVQLIIDTIREAEAVAAAAERVRIVGEILEMYPAVKDWATSGPVVLEQHRRREVAKTIALAIGRIQG
jgi:hypothetical protein